MASAVRGCWEAADIRAPSVDRPVPVVVARAVPYMPRSNRLQTLNLYLPATAETRRLIGQPIDARPSLDGSGTRSVQVHVHGGAWRDPMLGASSIEAAAALSFASPDDRPIAAIASLNYTLTQFPTHPGAPYDAAADGHVDPAREAVHPDHVRDVLQGLNFLRTLGLADGSYVLSGHSCGACIALQAMLAEPSYFGLDDVPEPPVAAAFVGINGLYDLPGLVLGLGPSHEINSHDYRVMLTNAFGPDDRVWSAVSPARLPPARMCERAAQGKVPRLIWVAQSPNDQLVPMEQLRRLSDNLARVDGVRFAQGVSSGRHSDPWQTGVDLYNGVRQSLGLLGS